MKMWCILTIVGLLQLGCVFGQRVAPGVPPQHYQAQPQQYGQVPQQQQQAQYQQQQQQVHQQQVPVQQQQVYQQQVPQQQATNQIHQQQQQQQPLQYHHGFNTGNMEHEKEHIAEHLEVPIDTSKMTEQELQFHYFKMHDADNNNKLDGCELIKSLIHWHEQGSKDKSGQIKDKIFKDEELITLIDPILSVDDTNQDGYIDYPEFVRAQQKAAQTKPSH